MGTRADFYVGTEWIGSIAYDGGEIQGDPITQAKTADEFRAKVAEEFASRDDATLPAQGWPWPWKDSRTTDYAYVFKDGVVLVIAFGCLLDAEGNEIEEGFDFPDMSSQQNVAFGPRSGVLVLGVTTKS